MLVMFWGQQAVYCAGLLTGCMWSAGCTLCRPADRMHVVSRLYHCAGLLTGCMRSAGCILCRPADRMHEVSRLYIVQAC